MRMSRFFAFLTALVFSTVAFSHSVRAETKPPQNLGSIRDPEDQPVEKVDPQLANKLVEEEIPELPTTLGWELTIAKKGYQVSKTLRTTSDLVTALSKSIEYLCLGDLQRTLTYYPPPKEAPCLKALKMMKQVDAENPLLICTEGGFDTPDCTEAFEGQETTNLIPSQITDAYLKLSKDNYDQVQFQDDLTVKLQKERAEKGLANLRRLADQAQQKYNEAMSSGNKDGRAADFKLRREQLLSQFLQLSCGSYRAVVYPKEVLGTIRRTDPSYNSGKPGRNTSLEEMLEKGPFSEKIVAEKQRKITNRFRLVSERCMANLEIVSREVPTLAAISCQRSGIASPTCIQARKINEQSGAHGPRRIDTNDGLEKF